MNTAVVYVLLAVIAILIIILFVFLLYLFLHRHRENSRVAARERYLKRHTQSWYEYLFEYNHYSVTLEPRTRTDVEAIEVIFSSYIRNVINPEIIQKIQEFSNSCLKKYYKEDLLSKRWSIRMNALYRIAEFKIDELVEECKKLENKKISREEYFQLFKVYSVCQVGTFVEKLKSIQGTYPESEYRRLLILLDNEVLIQFFEDFQSWPIHIQLAVIDTAASKKHMQYVDLLKKILSEDNSELRIRALKGIYEIGIVDEIESYIPFVTSNKWEERLMVAKLFKHSPIDYVYTYLEKLLQDEHWRVRAQAAATLAEGRQGTHKLKQFIQLSDDKYAVEIATEMLIKRQEI